LGFEVVERRSAARLDDFVGLEGAARDLAAVRAGELLTLPRLLAANPRRHIDLHPTILRSLGAGEVIGGSESR